MAGSAARRSAQLLGLPCTGFDFGRQVPPPARKVEPSFPRVRISFASSLPIANTSHIAALPGLYRVIIVLRLPTGVPHLRGRGAVTPAVPPASFPHNQNLPCGPQICRGCADPITARERRV